uniref:HAP1 N-terminal domain-containing protein n=1 Tax=Panagrellus redivivus TaxID=6233 RepID=A0A7E4VZX3_PANRE
MANRGPEMMDDMLRQIQGVVDGLKVKSDACANLAVQSSTVTDKLAVMKEYNQEVSAVNHVRAPDGRTNLVASLQHESRQIQALQEENRQMEYTIRSMQDGMDFLMNKHREVVDGMHRSDRMIDLLDKLELVPPGDRDAHIGQLANLTRDVIDRAEQKECMYNKALAQLKMENETLRQLLTASRMSDYILQAAKRDAEKNGCTECQNRKLRKKKRYDSGSSSDSVVTVIQIPGKNTANPIVLPEGFQESLADSSEDESDSRADTGSSICGVGTFTDNPDYCLGHKRDSSRSDSEESSFAASASEYLAYPRFDDSEFQTAPNPDESFLEEVSVLNTAFIFFDEEDPEDDETTTDSDESSEAVTVIENPAYRRFEDKENFIYPGYDTSLDVKWVNTNNNGACFDDKNSKTNTILTKSTSSGSFVGRAPFRCLDDDLTEDAYVGFVCLFALDQHALTLSSRFGRF